MRIGVMYLNRARLGPTEAIRAALLEWNKAAHTNGFDPMEARFNPHECPDDPLLCGLVVLADDQVAGGHVRLTTCDLTIEDEWAGTKTAIEAEVGELAA